MGAHHKLAPDRSTATKKPNKAKENIHVHDGKHPSTETPPQNHGARHQKQRAEGKVEASARVSSSSPSSPRLRSSVNGRKISNTGGLGPDGGGDNTHRNPDAPVTTTTEGQHQKRHRGAQRSGVDYPNHPHGVDVARVGREGSSKSASSPSESGRPSSQQPSVWDVGQPATGLADIDSASTMNGLLDREVRRDRPRSTVAGWKGSCLHCQRMAQFRGLRHWVER